MKTSDIRKNPAFAPYLFEIEKRIHEAVQVAGEQGIDLSDSKIRSTVIKARKAAEGGSPKVAVESARDKILFDLYRSLVEARESVLMEVEGSEKRMPLPMRYWILCLRTVEESIQFHSTGAGSKGYQQYIAPFITGAY